MELKLPCKQFVVPVSIEVQGSCAVSQAFILKGSEVDLSCSPLFLSPLFQ